MNAFSAALNAGCAVLNVLLFLASKNPVPAILAAFTAAAAVWHTIQALREKKD